MVLTTYCVEYAPSQRSKCQGCDKIIPTASLRLGAIEREGKKQKKQFAKHSWWHFKCFKVPEVLTKIPLDMFRGYPAIREMDQERVARLVALGSGAQWQQIVDRHKKRFAGVPAEDDASGKTKSNSKPSEASKKMGRAAESASEKFRKRRRAADDVADERKSELNNSKAEPKNSKKRKTAAKDAADARKTATNKRRDELREGKNTGRRGKL